MHEISVDGIEDGYEMKRRVTENNNKNNRYCNMTPCKVDLLGICIQVILDKLKLLFTFTTDGQSLVIIG